MILAGALVCETNAGGNVLLQAAPDLSAAAGHILPPPYMAACYLEIEERSATIFL
jgi:hypothetical protein